MKLPSSLHRRPLNPPKKPASGENVEAGGRRLPSSSRRHPPPPLLLQSTAHGAQASAQSPASPPPPRRLRSSPRPDRAPGRGARPARRRDLQAEAGRDLGEAGLEQDGGGDRHPR